MQPLRFVVLIPHRDSGRLLWAYRRTLFAAGLPGAYSFPGVAPLAVVSQPFTTEELKTLAHTLREISVQNERGGKISTQDWGSLAYFPSTGEAKSVPYIFGPFLDLPNPDLSRVLYRFPRLVLAAGFITTEDKERLPSLNLPKAPGFFFRAGMVANMVFSPLSSGAPGYSFAWQIGTPVWMPAYKVHHSLGI